jgi:hypothetical protein
MPRSQFSLEDENPVPLAAIAEPAQGRARRRKSSFAKWVASAGGVIVLVALATIWFRIDHGKRSENQEKQQIGKQILAQDLYMKYRKSPQIADRTFKGKMLSVSGQIEKPSKDEWGYYVDFFVLNEAPAVENIQHTWRRIAAASMEGPQGVRCYFSSSKKLPRTGSYVEITGRCKGKPHMVILDYCTWKPSSP